MKVAIALLGSGFLMAFTCQAMGADLRMRFLYEGQPPVPKPILTQADAPFCGKQKLLDEDLLVNEKNKGIANVVVYLYTGRKGTDLAKLDVPPPEKRMLKIVNKECRFEPRVVVSRVGDTLVVANEDPVGHNQNFSFLNRPASGLTIPRGGRRMIQFTQSEPAPVPIACNIHPWESACLLVLDHRFAAVSDADGYLTISGLPKNQPLVFRVYHEQLTFKEGIMVDGQPTVWERNLFSHTIGVDDSVVKQVKVAILP